MKHLMNVVRERWCYLGFADFVFQDEESNRSLIRSEINRSDWKTFYEDCSSNWTVMKRRQNLTRKANGEFICHEI